MLLNSINYFIYFFSMVVLFYSLPYRFRPILLLAGSYLFYMSWMPQFVILLILSTIVAYIFSINIGNAVNEDLKKKLLKMALFINISILVLFKYLGFFDNSLSIVFKSLGVFFTFPEIKFLLPVGISFYTFRIISYLVDVYRGEIKAESNFIQFALYVAFFPQLLAGPIERATNLIPQFYQKQEFLLSQVVNGCTLILWGLFKKVVVADRLSIYVDAVYNNVYNHSGLSYILATYCYSIQIYCDFSGYSDIAIGSAMVLGFHTMQNFNLPYLATSFQDFWRRWHISLSSWFRDYLYIPLGGNRMGAARLYINLLIVMLLCGLWHGAAWSFILWGGLHGTMLCFSRISMPYRDALIKRYHFPTAMVKWFRIFLTFNLVSLLWIFFRAASLSDAAHIITQLFSGWPTLEIDANTFIHAAFGITILVIVDFVQRHDEKIFFFEEWPMGIRCAFVYFCIYSVVLFGVDGGSQFIYFQF